MPKLRPDFKTIPDFRKDNDRGDQARGPASSFSSAASWSCSEAGGDQERPVYPMARERGMNLKLAPVPPHSGPALEAAECAPEHKRFASSASEDPVPLL